jgi:hypothetical protein
MTLNERPNSGFGPLQEFINPEPRNRRFGKNTIQLVRFVAGKKGLDRIRDRVNKDDFSLVSSRQRDRVGGPYIRLSR